MTWRTLFALGCIGTTIQRLLGRRAAIEGRPLPGAACLILLALQDVRQPLPVHHVALRVASTNLHYCLDRLAEAGLIRMERAERDRRLTLVGITEEGRRFAGRLSTWLETEGLRAVRLQLSPEVTDVLKPILGFDAGKEGTS